MIAVKKLTKYDLPERKFLREVDCLTKAKHKNVVRFLGYCYEIKGEIADFKGKKVMSDTRNWLLCFEFVPNGSLDNHITGNAQKYLLPYLFPY
jgi:coatomer subunit beta'